MLKHFARKLDNSHFKWTHFQSMKFSSFHIFPKKYIHIPVRKKKQVTFFQPSCTSSSYPRRNFFVLFLSYGQINIHDLNMHLKLF